MAYPLYFVRITDRSGTFDTPRVGRVNGRLAFEAWMEKLGETCLFVELFTFDSNGGEIALECASLNSALFDGVKARAEPEFAQARLFE